MVSSSWRPCLPAAVWTGLPASGHRCRPRFSLTILDIPFASSLWWSHVSCIPLLLLLLLVLLFSVLFWWRIASVDSWKGIYRGKSFWDLENVFILFSHLTIWLGTCQSRLEILFPQNFEGLSTIFWLPALLLKSPKLAFYICIKSMGVALFISPELFWSLTLWMSPVWLWVFFLSGIL